MYYPFLRAKKHELLTLLSVPASTFSKMLPILEPVSVTAYSLSSYRKLNTSGRPFILITNPHHGDATPGDVQRFLVAGELATHPALTLGFLVDNSFTMAALSGFLASNTSHKKAVIFKHAPKPSDVAAIVTLLKSHPEVEHLIFEDTRLPIARSFSWHPQRVVLHDGFQREKKNADYGSDSTFPSFMDDAGGMGFQGFGDYLIVGDMYRDNSGGAGFVVALHVTIPDGRDLNVHHFCSVSDSGIRGLESDKFREACASLATSPAVLALARTTGLNDFFDWYSRVHYPGLGKAKQAAMQHHVEVVCAAI
jgi:hypothetical protein